MSRDDDTLDSGVRVLRVSTAAPADGEATRARVLGLLERGRLRRARLRRFGVAGLTVLAILSLGGAAWTALGHLRARPTTPATRARELATAATSARRSVSPPPSPSSALSEAPSGAAPSVVAQPPLRPPPPAVADRAPTPPPTAPDAETRLYARAHDAHFTHDTPAQALAAWNRYLAAYPRGTFAPDARFNRALCLLRLGQRSAAAEALRPFADGAYHGYRRLEAESLLDWLARQPP